MRGGGTGWARTGLALAAIAAAPAPAGAQSAGGASCTLSATPLIFGRYVPSRSAPVDFTATLQLACTSSGAGPEPIDGTISLIGAGGPAGRELGNGQHRLRYQLFLDPAKTIIWGDGSAGTSRISVSGIVGAQASLRQSYTIYGRLLARQPSAVVGQYGDRVTAVLNY